MISLTQQNLQTLSKTRCNSTEDLEVHHKRIDGGNDIDNAELLCHYCHEHTSSYGKNGHPSPPEFNEDVKLKVYIRAGGKCECTRSHCHDEKSKNEYLQRKLMEEYYKVNR